MREDRVEGYMVGCCRYGDTNLRRDESDSDMRAAWVYSDHEYDEFG